MSASASSSSSSSTTDVEPSKRSKRNSRPPAEYPRGSVYLDGMGGDWLRKQEALFEACPPVEEAAESDLESSDDGLSETESEAGEVAPAPESDLADNKAPPSKRKRT